FDLKKELEISVIMQQLLTILINLKKSEEFVIKYGNHRNELENSIAFMQKNFSEKISVEQLAQICHVSKCYYIKIFKAYTGQTPYEYLQNVRLQHSKLSLMENIKSVEEIAQESGFSESKNFIASFKVKVGMTPMQFRKQNRF
ncbi:MAG: helix-turn-helix domain-containing protein, partial [Oliverpabstia sp.]